MKRIIALAAIFVLAATMLTACRFGKDDTTTTGDRSTLPETTGATITTPMETTTRPTESTRPSTIPTTPGTEGTTMPGTTDGTGTEPGGTTTPGQRGRNRGTMPGRY